MVKLKIRPIERWPGELAKSRKTSPFRSGYRDTLELIERELTALHARNVVVQLAVRESEIAIDGHLKGYAKPAHPGVLLAFEWWKPLGRRNEQGKELGSYTPIVFPCDRFTDWKDNLRAIALAMEALRKIDRYGVTRRGEQYKGWIALPEVGALHSDEEAAQTLIKHSNTGDSFGDVLKNPEVAKLVYRAACRLTHPDQGGTNEAFQAVQTAWARLKVRHGLNAAGGEQ